MHRPVALYEMLYGLCAIAGGIIGYVNASSMISMISGILSGITLVFAGTQIQKKSRTGLIVALVVTLALQGFFIPKFITHQIMFPYGVMSALGLLSILFLLLVFVQPKERRRDF